ncbi:DUF4382 domain-containing protein [Maribellus comscasis]|uniref:DUF4382 domain-containing protein n=1 Tax=Maribellus comscasis TaxID=2681766 RepID=A0A6I6JXC8_9BACT|nr:DUF4382 domain-containing protein [Maribellus comscasis]QGY44792.1 DUF4382 domain-containing protein [Maribellus comscasis]
MRKLKFIIIGIVVSIAMISCNNNDEKISMDGKGRINVHLTDSPFPVGLISHTYVTIDRVEIRQKTEVDMEESDDTFLVLSEETMVVDLLELTNGITEQIASVDLEAGYYDMLRLRVTDATVVLTNGSEFDLKVPSGSSSGLKVKIQPEIYLEEGQTSDVLLDFDVSKSFVVKGPLDNIKGFNFKPVVRGVYMGAAGRIEGNVTDTLEAPLEDVMVKAWLISEMENSNLEEDSTYVSSFTDEFGDYKIIGLREGTYTVVCEIEGYESDTLNNVSVIAGEAVSVDFELK